MALYIKTKNKYFLAIGLGIFSVLFVGLYAHIMRELNHETLAVSIPDENLRQCIIDEYNSLYWGSYSSIEEIDPNEITSLSCSNKNIYSLDGIENFSNLEFLDIRFNNINSLAPVVGLEKLYSLWISGNLLNVSPLRSFDEDSLAILKNLHQKDVVVEGADRQRLDYNQDFANGKPQIHVLFVDVIDIDSNVVNNGVTINYKHTMTELEKEYFDAIRLQFERVVEKLSNYRFDIITDVYYTTKTYSFTKSEYGDEYWLFAEDIDEIDSIRQNYDSIVVNAIYSDEIPRDCDGLGGLGQAMFYYIEKDSDYYNKIIADMDNNLIDYNVVPSVVHEFIHSIEYYGYYTGQNIWEWHAVKDYFHPLFDSEYGLFDPMELNREALYMRGAVINPDVPGQTGFTDAIIYLPYSRLLKNKDKEVVPSVDSLSLLVGEEKQLYAVGLANVDDQRSFDIIEWSSANQDVVTIDSNGLVTAVGVGKTDIIAKVKDSDSFATIEVEVNGLLSFDSTEIIKTYGDASFVNLATTTSDGVITYSSSDTSIAEVNSETGEVTIKKAGEVTITATVAATNNYNSASASYTLTINKRTATVSFENNTITMTFGDANFTNAATTTGDGDVVYESSNSNVATVDSATGEVTIVGAGNATITANVAATDNYEASSASYSLVVNKKKSSKPNEVSSIKHGYVTDKIGTVILTTSGMMWDDPNAEIKEGQNSYLVKYTENNDSANYTTESFEIIVDGERRAYEVIEGDGQTYIINEGEYMVFKVNADYALFEDGGEVYIDDELLDSKYYTSESGSTIIKISNDYVKELSAGNHELAVYFKDGGVATAEFVTEEPDIDAPDTGRLTNDNDALSKMSIIGINGAMMTLGCIAFVIIKKKIVRKRL